MAELTPNDVINRQFRHTLRGYATDEVEEFLQQVADTLYQALQEAQQLRSEVASLRDRVRQYQDTEALIKNALVLAERTADDIRRHAHEEADLLRREVAQTLRAEQAEVETLRHERERMIAELRATLQAHWSMLDAREKREAPTSNGGQR
jgi:cell division initiation protein